MALHSSYQDYHDYQHANLFFDDLKKTPPQRLKYFFVPELDYTGYLHVIRDQEDKAFRKEFRHNQFTACRQEQMQKTRERHSRRAAFEAALRPDDPPQPDTADSSLAVSVTPYRTATQRWGDNRKRKMERRAISMIESRMSAETAELQLFEGWRAASQGCIRDKFRETLSNNRMVEERLRMPHTQNVGKRHGKSHTSMGFASTGQVNSLSMQSTQNMQSSTGTPQSAIQDMNQSMNDITYADDEVGAITTIDTAQHAAVAPTFEPPLRSPLESPGDVMYKTTASDLISEGLLSPTQSPTRKHRAPLSPCESTREDLDSFEDKLRGRLVATNQRLRSLAVDATKTWTRPASDPLNLPSPNY